MTEQIELLETLAESFGEISSDNCGLRDHCLFQRDKDNALLRQLFCMDTARALRLTAKKIKDQHERTLSQRTVPV